MSTHVVIYRDLEGTNEITVFVDGQPVTAQVWDFESDSGRDTSDIDDDATAVEAGNLPDAVRALCRLYVEAQRRALADDVYPPPCDMPDGCGAPAGEPCLPGCPSWATDDAHAMVSDHDDDPPRATGP